MFFLNQETLQIRKVVLQNQIAPDILTATQGGTCALKMQECYTYIPDNTNLYLHLKGHTLLPNNTHSQNEMVVAL